MSNNITISKPQDIAHTRQNSCYFQPFCDMRWMNPVCDVPHKNNAIKKEGYETLLVMDRMEMVWWESVLRYISVEHGIG